MKEKPSEVVSQKKLAETMNYLQSIQDNLKVVEQTFQENDTNINNSMTYENENQENFQNSQIQEEVEDEDEEEAQWIDTFTDQFKSWITKLSQQQQSTLQQPQEIQVQQSPQVQNPQVQNSQVQNSQEEQKIEQPQEQGFMQLKKTLPKPKQQWVEEELPTNVYVSRFNEFLAPSTDGQSKQRFKNFTSKLLFWDSAELSQKIQEQNLNLVSKDVTNKYQRNQEVANSLKLLSAIYIPYRQQQSFQVTQLRSLVKRVLNNKGNIEEQLPKIQEFVKEQKAWLIRQKILKEEQIQGLENFDLQEDPTSLLQFNDIVRKRNPNNKGQSTRLLNEAGIKCQIYQTTKEAKDHAKKLKTATKQDYMTRVQVTIKPATEQWTIVQQALQPLIEKQIQIDNMKRLLSGNKMDEEFKLTDLTQMPFRESTSKIMNKYISTGQTKETMTRGEVLALLKKQTEWTLKEGGLRQFAFDLEKLNLQKLEDKQARETNQFCTKNCSQTLMNIPPAKNTNITNVKTIQINKENGTISISADMRFGIEPSQEQKKEYVQNSMLDVKDPLKEMLGTQPGVELQQTISINQSIFRDKEKTNEILTQKLNSKIPNKQQEQSSTKLSQKKEYQLENKPGEQQVDSSLLSQSTNPSLDNLGSESQTPKPKGNLQKLQALLEMITNFLTTLIQGEQDIKQKLFQDPNNKELQTKREGQQGLIQEVQKTMKEVEDRISNLRQKQTQSKGKPRTIPIKTEVLFDKQNNQSELTSKNLKEHNQKYESTLKPQQVQSSDDSSNESVYQTQQQSTKIKLQQLQKPKLTQKQLQNANENYENDKAGDQNLLEQEKNQAQEAFNTELKAQLSEQFTKQLFLIQSLQNEIVMMKNQYQNLSQTMEKQQTQSEYIPSLDAQDKSGLLQKSKTISGKEPLQEEVKVQVQQTQIQSQEQQAQIQSQTPIKEGVKVKEQQAQIQSQEQSQTPIKQEVKDPSQEQQAQTPIKQGVQDQSQEQQAQIPIKEVKVKDQSQIKEEESLETTKIDKIQKKQEDLDKEDYEETQNLSQLITSQKQQQGKLNESVSSNENLEQSFTSEKSQTNESQNFNSSFEQQEQSYDEEYSQDEQLLEEDPKSQGFEVQDIPVAVPQHMEINAIGSQKISQKLQQDLSQSIQSLNQSVIQSLNSSSQPSIKKQQHHIKGGTNHGTMNKKLSQEEQQKVKKSLEEVQQKAKSAVILPSDKWQKKIKKDNNQSLNSSYMSY